MSKEFMSLNKEYRDLYEHNINNMLETISTNDRFDDNIRNLCKYALTNNWSLEKKVNILNIVTQ